MPFVGDAIKAMSEVNCCRRFLFKMSLLVSVDELFWPIVLCALYVAVGKMFIFFSYENYQFLFYCLIFYLFLKVLGLLATLLMKVLEYVLCGVLFWLVIFYQVV